jgi:uncharacterized small protein (DUF1192 family)
MGCEVQKAGSEDMDWDDIRPPQPKAKGITIGDDLATLSVAELEARVAALEAEIQRVKAEADQKRKHEAAASALFDFFNPGISNTRPEIKSRGIGTSTTLYASLGINA